MTSDTFDPLGHRDGSAFSFERYRRLVDGRAVGARLTGLGDEALAEAALKDVRTLTADHGGLRLPIATPLEYVAGYDVDRCRQLAPAASTIYYLDVPPFFPGEAIAGLAGLLDDRLQPGDAMLLEYSECDPAAERLYEALLAAMPRPCAESDAFRDENGSQASMTLYAAESEVPTGGRPRHVESQAASYPVRLSAPGPYPRDGVVTLTNSALSDQLLDELWDLYQRRFSWLGENHPVSMEDTEASFRSLLMDESAVTPVLFENGAAICFTYYLGSTKACYWLNDTVLTALTARSRGAFRFFGGIVSAQPGGNGMRIVLEALALDVARVGSDVQIVFEATNKSEKYIPHLVRKYVNDTKIVRCAEPRVIDRQVYRLFVAGRAPSRQ